MRGETRTIGTGNRGRKVAPAVALSLLLLASLAAATLAEVTLRVEGMT